ncbi:hypothetical protein [Streptomyces katrae]|nr:hypothetical protein [Streptomyces katrae]
MSRSCRVLLRPTATEGMKKALLGGGDDGRELKQLEKDLLVG